MSYEPADAAGIEPCKAGRLARVQAGFRRQSDCASRCGAGGTRTHKAASTARLFSGQVPSAYRLAAPNAESQTFELPRRSSRPAPLPTVPLVPSGHSPCGRRADRTPAGLPPRPPVSNRVPYHLGQPSVRREGLAPSRPFRAHVPGATRLCKPHTLHQESASSPRLLRSAGSGTARHLP